MLRAWRVLKDSWFLQVQVLSGKVPEYPVADSSRKERSSRAERSVESPSFKEGEQTSGPQQSVNAIASTNYQPKGVREGRAAHVTAKAIDKVGKPSNARGHTPTVDLCGVWGVGTF